MLLRIVVLMAGLLVFLAAGSLASASLTSAYAPAAIENAAVQKNLSVNEADRFAAMQRHVEVNGKRLDQQQLGAFDLAVCAELPNGRYWHNEQTGFWGRAGNPMPSGRYQQCEKAAG